MQMACYAKETTRREAQRGEGGVGLDGFAQRGGASEQRFGPLGWRLGGGGSEECRVLGVVESGDTCPTGR